MNDIRQLLIEEEGVVPHAYPDPLGYLTIGVGHLIDKRKGGRLPAPIIEALLDYDIREKRLQAELLPGYELLNDVQKAVLISMVFQLGFSGVRNFRKMCIALANRDVRAAAREGRDSKWAKEDTPERAERQMQMLETGLWVPRTFK